MKKVRITVLSFLLVFIATYSLGATKADIKNFNFTIIANTWASFSSKNHSYKYYNGTMRLDKSAYVVNTTKNTGVTMKHYYQNNGKRRNDDQLQRGAVRSTYANSGVSKHRGTFWAKRENFFDGPAKVEGTWSSDDGRK